VYACNKNDSFDMLGFNRKIKVFECCRKEEEAAKFVWTLVQGSS
jgi:hypothetical protein